MHFLGYRRVFETFAIRRTARAYLMPHCCCLLGCRCTVHSTTGPHLMHCRHSCCRFEDTGDLQVSSPTSALQPGEACDVAITFNPQQARTYSETVPFKINGLYVVNVLIMGEAAPLRLSCANPAHQNLHLGSVSKGSQASKTVQVGLHTGWRCHIVLQQCIRCQAPSSLSMTGQDGALSSQLALLQCASRYYAQLQRVTVAYIRPDAKEESTCRW